MHRTRRQFNFCSLLGLMMVWSADCARSQDMTVYTTVSVASERGAKGKLIGRSLTLFHAGKVYDFMEDVGELVVYDPRTTQFVILNRDYTATRVEHSELNQFIKVARVESTKFVDELSQSSDATARARAELLRFQLQPAFQEQMQTDRRFALQSDIMRYDAEVAAAPEPPLVEQYLSYADWTARLNFVLHPRSSYPAPRIQLNEALRSRGVLPVSVELWMQLDKPVTLKAEHKYQWSLQASDKSLIHKWERLIESEQVRWVGFHEYQQRLLADADRRSK